MRTTAAAATADSIVRFVVWHRDVFRQWDFIQRRRHRCCGHPARPTRWRTRNKQPRKGGVSLAWWWGWGSAAPCSGTAAVGGAWWHHAARTTSTTSTTPVDQRPFSCFSVMLTFPRPKLLQLVRRVLAHPDLHFGQLFAELLLLELKRQFRVHVVTLSFPFLQFFEFFDYPFWILDLHCEFAYLLPNLLVLLNHNTVGSVDWSGVEGTRWCQMERV